MAKSSSIVAPADYPAPPSTLAQGLAEGALIDLPKVSRWLPVCVAAVEAGVPLIPPAESAAEVGTPLATGTTEPIPANS